MNRETFDGDVRKLLADARPTLPAGWQEEAVSALRTTRVERKPRPKVAYALGLAVVAGLVAAGVLLRPSVPPSQNTATPPGRKLTIAAAPVAPPTRQAVSTASVGGTCAIGVRPAVLQTAHSAQPQMVAATTVDKQLLAVVAAKGMATDGAGQALRVGARLPAGCVVRTGGDGRVTLVTRRGSELTLGAKSSLALSSDGRTADLQAGRVYCRNRGHEFAALTTPRGESNCWEPWLTRPCKRRSPWR